MYCCTPKALYNHEGGLSSISTSVQHPPGWCDGSHSTIAPAHSPHTSYRWREERVMEPIQWMGIIRRPWLTKASGGNLARTPGLHPYTPTLYEKCVMEVCVHINPIMIKIHPVFFLNPYFKILFLKSGCSEIPVRMK